MKRAEPSGEFLVENGGGGARIGEERSKKERSGNKCTAQSLTVRGIRKFVVTVL